MFEQTLAATQTQSHRAFSTMLGFTAQCAMVTAAVLVPMIFPDSLPQMQQTVIGIFTPTAPPPPPPPAPVQVASNPVPRPTQFNGHELILPTRIPDKPQIIDEPPLPAQDMGFRPGVVSGVAGGTENGVPGGVLNSVLNQVNRVRPAPPAAPAQTVSPAPPERIQVGGKVQDAMILRKVIPVYPPLARAARISGTVYLVGLIGTDGRIHELRVESGHPMLIGAALAAVRQWTYRPTLLNDKAVEVVAPIQVIFTLN